MGIKNLMIRIVQIENGWVLVLGDNGPYAKQVYFDSMRGLAEALPFEVEAFEASIKVPNGRLAEAPVSG